MSRHVRFASRHVRIGGTLQDSVEVTTKVLPDAVIALGIIVVGERRGVVGLDTKDADL
jgi:hypothetical protein